MKTPRPTTKAPDAIAKAPGGLPLLGHALQLRHPLGFLARLPAYGDLVQIRLGTATAVVVCDAGLTRSLLLDDRTFDKGGPFYKRGREFLGDGLGTCPHSQHRRRRRLAQPAFHHTRMPGYARTMAAHIAALISTWNDGQIVDVNADMWALASRGAVETMFSGALPDAALRQTCADLTIVFQGSYRRMFWPPPLDRLPTAGNRRYHRSRARMRHTITSIIAQRRDSGADRGDLLSALLAARDDADPAGGHGSGLSEAELADEVVTFLLGGLESTASTLAWALHVLAGDSGLQERLHAEVDAVLAGAPPGHVHLPRLELTGRIVTETLRIWPPGWIFTRVATADTRLGSYPIPAGTNLIFSPYVLHRRPDLYPEPDRFDPDRHNAPDRQPPLTAYLPFGAGARKCIGDRFALTEAVLALASIAARWHLYPIPGEHVRPVPRFTLRPSEGHVRVRARTAAAADPAARSITTTPTTR